MIIKPITIKYKPILKWSRSYDLYILATRVNELILSNNQYEERLRKIEEKLEIPVNPAPKSD
jgi:hypothetical protein